jgi:pyruvate-formate lyase-activating enzyme
MAEWNYLYREAVLRMLCRAKELRARLRGRRFHCRSLAGEDPWAVFVNCDMTVSCNCQDFDGSGQLGSLREQAFEGLFAGRRAAAFRQMLAGGRLPISRCGACALLDTLPAAEAEARADKYQLPKGLGVENTVLCNLRCLNCCRGKVTEIRSRRRLSLDDATVVAETLRRLDAEFCGYYNLGEPFLSPTIGEELAIIRRLNPAIRLFTSTNGLAIDDDRKREAAMMFDEIVVSLDGTDNRMVRRYQRGGDFDRAYANLRALVEHRHRQGREKPCILWKYVVFRWNDRPAIINRALELAWEAGVDGVQFTFARTPVWGVSWRFHLSPFFRRLAPRKGRYRHVWFNEPTACEAASGPCKCEAASGPSVAYAGRVDAAAKL